MYGAASWCYESPGLRVGIQSFTTRLLLLSRASRGGKDARGRICPSGPPQLEIKQLSREWDAFRLQALSTEALKRACSPNLWILFGWGRVKQRHNCLARASILR